MTEVEDTGHLSAILVTGASGQVGGALVEELVRRVGGSEPRSFGEFVQDHASHFAAGLSSHM